MCTVSFVPVQDGVLLASNRDEKHYRSDALPPMVYETGRGRMLYPRDADAGGTWIGLHEAGQAVIFLNGAFQRHTSQPPYRRSRGLILLDLFSFPDPLEGFQSISLEGIEPFTAVIWSGGQLVECRWDGGKKHFTRKRTDIAHIWSSVTLYEPEVIQRREQWFSNWLALHPMPGLDDLLHFHEFTGDGDHHNDLLMNRDGYVFTVSITGMHIGNTEALMKYMDLKKRSGQDEWLQLVQKNAQVNG